MDDEDAAHIAAGDARRLRTRDDFGLLELIDARQRVLRTLPLRAPARAPPARRSTVPPRRSSSSSAGRMRGSGTRSHRFDCGRRRRQEAGHDCLRPGAVGSGRRAVRFDAHYLAICAQRVEAGCFSRRFPAAEHPSEIAELVAASRQFPLTHLGRPQIGEGQAHIGAQPPQPRVSTARRRVYSSGGGAHVQAAPPVDWQHLGHHHHVLADAGDSLAVERDARIGPPTGGETFRQRDVHARARAARTCGLSGASCASSCDRQRQRLSASARGHHARKLAPHPAPECA